MPEPHFERAMKLCAPESGVLDSQDDKLFQQLLENPAEAQALLLDHWSPTGHEELFEMMKACRAIAIASGARYKPIAGLTPNQLAQRFESAANAYHANPKVRYTIFIHSSYRYFTGQRGETRDALPQRSPMHWQFTKQYKCEWIPLCNFDNVFMWLSRNSCWIQPSLSSLLSIGKDS